MSLFHLGILDDLISSDCVTTEDLTERIRALHPPVDGLVTDRRSTPWHEEDGFYAVVIHPKVDS